MRSALVSHLRSCLAQLAVVTVTLNALDGREAGPSGMYLSVLGTSAEDADSGAVGRGNQVNGIIALRRPRGSEAAAGKNPVSHEGKIYSVLTHLWRTRFISKFQASAKSSYGFVVALAIRWDRPQGVSVEVNLKGKTTLAGVIDLINEILRREISRMPIFCQELAEGKYAIC